MKPTGTILIEKTNQSETKKGRKITLKKNVHTDYSFQTMNFQDKPKKIILRRCMYTQLVRNKKWKHLKRDTKEEKAKRFCQ